MVVEREGEACGGLGGEGGGRRLHEDKLKTNDMERTRILLIGLTKATQERGRDGYVKESGKVVMKKENLRRGAVEEECQK